MNLSNDVLVKQITSIEPNEATQLKLIEKSKPQLKAILMDMTMRLNRE